MEPFLICCLIGDGWKRNYVSKISKDVWAVSHRDCSDKKEL